MDSTSTGVPLRDVDESAYNYVFRLRALQEQIDGVIEETYFNIKANLNCVECDRPLKDIVSCECHIYKHVCIECAH